MGDQRPRRAPAKRTSRAGTEGPIGAAPRDVIVSPASRPGKCGPLAVETGVARVPVSGSSRQFRLRGRPAHTPIARSGAVQSSDAPRQPARTFASACKTALARGIARRRNASSSANGAKRQAPMPGARPIIRCCQRIRKSETARAAAIVSRWRHLPRTPPRRLRVALAGVQSRPAACNGIRLRGFSPAVSALSPRRPQWRGARYGGNFTSGRSGRGDRLLRLHRRPYGA